MIELHSPPEIERDPQEGWQLTFWMGVPFDYETPFRKVLSEIAEALGQDPVGDLHLPPHKEGEDFVEGTLRYGQKTLRIYFEHSLSYLALMCDQKDTLQEVAERLRSRVRLS